ncbi:GNAT family N-acetyltransferase [Streptomyces sp. GSL17-111]|uniref:GNAT family N-acetyltransferase n=1 Tax=Streptomyces sp. GSL17-111 TaxID=3121596 RepID=UPI0030F46D90
MGIAAAARRVSVRPYDDAADREAVLSLIAADRLVGQPVGTSGMLTEALAGRSAVDAGWWAELDPPVTDLAQDAAGQVLGVVSYATRASDGAGLILWLHCCEDHGVAQALVAHVLGRLGSRTVFAFEFASALTAGLEGLPVRHRAATQAALEEAGFAGRDLWRYMHRPLPAADLPRAAQVHVRDCEELPGKQVEIREGGEVLAQATIGRPEAGIGVLWWISVTPTARGRGLGMGLLGTSLDLLTGLGADEVILYVDDNAPGDPERDRTAANALYDRAGFREVDRLFSFTRQPCPPVE